MAQVLKKKTRNLPGMCNFKSGRETRPLRGIKRGQSDAAFYRISKSLVEWFRTQYKNVWEAKHN